MRENMGLYRGKRKDNGEWETGSLVVIRPDCSDQQTFIADKMTGYHTPVIPETVGQYTGLTDKNGVRIFEGDILDVSSDVAYGGVAVHRLGYFVVEFHNGCFMKSALDDPQLSFFDNAKRKGLYHFISTDIHKIVGNIHDNPELLQKI